MVDLELSIDRALAQPEAVMRSVADADARLYYRLERGTVVGDKYVCVVVKVLVADAFVVTAYLTDRIKPGERIWPANE